MKHKSELIFNNYIVDTVGFIRNECCTDEKFEIDADFSYSIKNNEENPNIAHVTVLVEIFKDAENKGYPFEMKIQVTGEFESENVSKYYANCIAILFPYVRSIVTTYTAAANITPLILPAINIAEMLEPSEETISSEEPTE